MTDADAVLLPEFDPEWKREGHDPGHDVERFPSPKAYDGYATPTEGSIGDRLGSFEILSLVDSRNP